MGFVLFRQVGPPSMKQPSNMLWMKTPRLARSQFRAFSSSRSALNEAAFKYALDESAPVSAFAVSCFFAWFQFGTEPYLHRPYQQNGLGMFTNVARFIKVSQATKPTLRVLSFAFRIVLYPTPSVESQFGPKTVIIWQGGGCARLYCAASVTQTRQN